ncbi:MAG: hypothetical protein MRY63_03080 [Neomegalonema sp.]|nr:hypothetical protein [Neomegalonema sp.]
MNSSVIPTLRYLDAPAMIDWLVAVIGFERQLIVEDGAGGIVHEELTLGAGMIMLGSAREDAFGALQKAPLTLGATTQSPYVVVQDVDGICERARQAGADIIREPHDEAYGGPPLFVSRPRTAFVECRLL